jgi:hypothetical protein
MPAVLKAMDYLLLELHAENRLEELSGGMRRSDVLQLLWDADLSVHYFAGHRAHHDHLNSGGFTYVPVTPANAEYLFYDRPRHVCLLVMPSHKDVEAVLGPSVKDPYFAY